MVRQPISRLQVTWAHGAAKQVAADRLCAVLLARCRQAKAKHRRGGWRFPLRTKLGHTWRWWWGIPQTLQSGCGITVQQRGNAAFPRVFISLMIRCQHKLSTIISCTAMVG